MLKIFRYASKFVHLDTLFRVVILLVRCLRRHVKQEKKKLEETDASTVGGKSLFDYARVGIVVSNIC